MQTSQRYVSKRHTAIPAPFGLFTHADKSKVCIIRDTLQYLLRLDCSHMQTSQRYVSKRHTAIPAPFGLFTHADKSKVCAKDISRGFAFDCLLILSDILAVYMLHSILCGNEP